MHRFFVMVGVVGGLATGCARLPEASDKPVTTALPAPAAGPLVSTARQLAAGRVSGESSLLLVAGNKEALDWRLALVDSARSSIDIQLYLWHDSSSARLLFDRVLKAADRGVRVRILVDDFLLRMNEKNFAALCREQPNLDIRIFNPTRVRGTRLGSALEFVGNFAELNRRMHNKTFTADRCLTIVGGRNISDHYFGLDEKYNFFDLDVLAAGPVVDEVAAGFDAFWNSAAAYPGELLSRRGGPQDVEKGRERLASRLEEERRTRLKSFSLEPRGWERELSGLRRSMVTGPARFLDDAPNREDDDRRVLAGIREMTDSRKGEVVIVSPYVLPSERAIDRFGQARDLGMTIKILAPSLAANNQPLAHGHYVKKREAMVDRGVHLFELKDQPGKELRALVDVDPVRAESVNLHAKAVVGDRSRCYVGSLNFDPRAMEINTESGLLIDSPEISHELFSLLQRCTTPENAWAVTLDERGKLVWKSGAQVGGKPPASWGKRALSWVSGLLPIESQL